MEAVRRKSVKLTAFLERLIENKLGGLWKSFPRGMSIERGRS